MGIKTLLFSIGLIISTPLKNLPTTWGLRLNDFKFLLFCNFSEKPPHHMGIKTAVWSAICCLASL